MAEGARLESVYTGNRIVGSNPTPSARMLIRGHSLCVIKMPNHWAVGRVVLVWELEPS